MRYSKDPNILTQSPYIILTFHQSTHTSCLEPVKELTHHIDILLATLILFALFRRIFRHHLHWFANRILLDLSILLSLGNMFQRAREYHN
jgi:hypothetical protein